MSTAGDIPLQEMTVHNNTRERYFMKVKKMATAFALLAAALYAVNIPFSKLLLRHIDATMLAALESGFVGGT